MSTNWTKVSKVTGTPWTNVNAPTKHNYDDALLAYDSSLVEYDGNSTDWTRVPKPNLGSAQIWTNMTSPWTSYPVTWSSLNSGTVWTNVAKPT